MGGGGHERDVLAHAPGGDRPRLPPAPGAIRPWRRGRGRRPGPPWEGRRDEAAVRGIEPQVAQRIWAEWRAAWISCPTEVWSNRAENSIVRSCLSAEGLSGTTVTTTYRPES